METVRETEHDKLGPIGAKTVILDNDQELRRALIAEFLSAAQGARDAAASVDKDVDDAVHEYRKSLRRARAILALVGWAGWNDATGLRGIAILVAYTVLIGLAARADTFYWAMMIAPLALLGLAFAPDTIGDLVTRALDRRRITVTKAVR